MALRTSSLSATFALLVLLLLAASCVQAKVTWKRATTSHPRRRPWDILDQVVHNHKPAFHPPGALSVVGLAYYVQVGIGGSDLQELIPAINTTTLNNFGRTQIFMFNVTEGEDPTSTQLGYMRGFVMQASYTSVGAGVEVEVLEYNDGTLNGTVSIQGLVFNGPTVVSVVGGTGDFAGAKGYGNVTLVTVIDSTVVYHHDLYFV